MPSFYWKRCAQTLCWEEGLSASMTKETDRKKLEKQKYSG